MKLYTSAAVARFLDLSERRVRQLRDEGILKEKQAGLYELIPAIHSYLDYLRGKNAGDSSVINLNQEKAKLAQIKRKQADFELRLSQGELHESADVENAISKMLVAFRAKILAIPSKLAPILAEQTKQEDVFDTLKLATNEALNELSNYDLIFENSDRSDSEDGLDSEESNDE